MADLLPSASGPDDGHDPRDDRDPRVIGLDSDEADDLLGAISSSTARTVLSSLHESPATATELTNEVDTSLQNVQYHLGNLEEAGLIEVVNTRYSEKGREMNVFGPADRALVVVAGRSDETNGLKNALSQLIGGVGVLGLGAAVINRLARSGSVLPFGTATSGGAESADVAASGNETYQMAGGSGNATTAATATPTATPASATEASVTETMQSGDGGFSIAEATTTEGTTVVVDEVTERAAIETTTTLQTPTPTPEATQQATETAVALTSGAPGIGETIATLSPGLLFFIGGLTVLCLWIGLGLVRN